MAIVGGDLRTAPRGSGPEGRQPHRPDRWRRAKRNSDRHTGVDVCTRLRVPRYTGLNPTAATQFVDDVLKRQWKRAGTAR